MRLRPPGPARPATRWSTPESPAPSACPPQRTQPGQRSHHPRVQFGLFPLQHVKVLDDLNVGHPGDPSRLVHMFDSTKNPYKTTDFDVGESPSLTPKTGP